MGSMAHSGKHCKHTVHTAYLKLYLLMSVRASTLFFILLLLVAGDIHPNPGPDTNIQEINKSLKVCHINVRSLTSLGLIHSTTFSKIDEIQNIATREEMDVICLTETWLDDRIDNIDITPPGFTCHRSDRKRDGGGVGMFLSDLVPAVRRLDLEVGNTECLWVECRLQSAKRGLIASYYRPPRQSAAEVANFLEDLQHSLNLVFLENPDFLLILGDFNDRCVEWESNHENSELKLQLYDLLRVNNLYQMVNKPTRITENSESLLDLIITDAPSYIQQHGQHPPISNLDHNIVYCSIVFQYNHQRVYKREVWDFKSANFELTNQSLFEAPWDTNFQIYDDINDMVDYWSQLFLYTCKEFIPCRQVLVRPRDKPWMTVEIRKLLRLRDRAWKRFRRTKNPYHNNIFKNTRHYCHLTISLAKKNYEEKTILKLTDPQTTPKTYWKVLKSVIGTKVNHNIPPLNVNDQPITNTTDKCEVFNKYFVEQSTQPPIPDGFALPPVLKPPYSLTHIFVSDNEVFKILNSLNVAKANGPDNISNKLLRETAPAIAKPLASIFNQSLSSGQFPDEWKKANVVPIFKKENRQTVKNYRPISLLPCVSKVLERIVFNKLLAYCQEHNLLTWRNAGFKPQDSTVNQLVIITHKILEALDQGKDICMVFLDISKAFDRVYHEGLLIKLQMFGIDGPLLLWFRSYLLGRKQRVVINGQYSSWQTTTAGVPQGSILGPLLFLIFINDLVDRLETNPFLFADDTSLLEILDCIDTSLTTVNNDLRHLTVWAAQWLVTFNPDKTTYMIISRKLNKINYNPLFMAGKQLKEVKSHKHLGVVLNNTMSWHDHAEYVCAKANKQVGLLRRVSRILPRQAKEIIYTSFIRPILEYSSVVFDGCPQRLSNSLEAVQRQAALACTGAYLRTTHSELLRELGWDRLAVRRQYQKLNLFYKIQNDLVPSYLGGLYNSGQHQTRYNLRNSANIAIPRTRTTSFMKSYIPSTIRLWNGLDPPLRASPTLNSFKSNLKRKLFTTKNPLYSVHSNIGSLNQTRMRMGLSGLNAHRHKYGFIPQSNCPLCHSPKEDPFHFFFICPNHAAHRQTLFNNVTPFFTGDFEYLSRFNILSRTDRTRVLNIFLYGSNNMIFDDNVNIFKHVHHFIINSSRF